MTKRKLILIFIVFFLAVAGLLAVLLTGRFREPVYTSSSSGVSDAEIRNADLPKLGTKALREKRIESKCAVIRLHGTFPDGSRKVMMVLANGREMKGRLYKERGRLKIAADLWSTLE